jgi:hypothetical protein
MDYGVNAEPGRRIAELKNSNVILSLFYIVTPDYILACSGEWLHIVGFAGSRIPIGWLVILLSPS